MTIHCDRCSQNVEGFIQPEGSAGVYVLVDANGPTYWARYGERRPEENIICDSCMWSTPTYVAAYGVHRHTAG